MSRSGELAPRFKLRTLLLFINVSLLLFPLLAAYFFRLFDNQLIRETEAELIAQGHFIASIYKFALKEAGAELSTYGLKVAPEQASATSAAVQNPELDLNKSSVLSTRPEAVPAEIPLDKIAERAAESRAELLRTALAATLAGVRITDYNAVVVFGKQESGLSLANVPELQQALRGRYQSVLRRRLSDEPDPPLDSLSRGSRLRVFVAMPVMQGERVLGAILLSRSPRNIFKSIYDNRYSTALVAVLVCGCLLLISTLTSIAINKPIQQLIAQASSVSRGERQTSEIKNPVTSEFAELSRALVEMSATVASRADYIKNFALLVSHEFKTPLTAIQGAVELIQEHGKQMSEAELARFLSNTQKDTQRLARLVTGLLELARADMQSSIPECCSLNAQISELKASYRDSALSIVSNAGEHLYLPLPADVLLNCLSNIAENALQHGASELRINVLSAADKISIWIHDNGPGISKANIDRLFSPFFTTRRAQGGTGLGLAIVRALLKTYQAEISYAENKEVGNKETGWGFLIEFIPY